MRTCCVLLAASVAGLVTALLPATAHAACDGAPLKQRVQRVDAVFVGTVDGTSTGAGGRSGEHGATVHVTDVYKGAVDPSVRVDPGDGSEAIGLEDGTQYLFFAQGKRARWSTDACLGTGPVTDRGLAAVEDLLGAPTSFRPVPGDAPGGNPEGNPESNPAHHPEKSTATGTTAARDQGDGTGGYVVVGALVAALLASFALPSLRRRARARTSGPQDDRSHNVGGDT